MFGSEYTVVAIVVAAMNGPALGAPDDPETACGSALGAKPARNSVLEPAGSADADETAVSPLLGAGTFDRHAATSVAAAPAARQRRRGAVMSPLTFLIP